MSPPGPTEPKPGTFEAHLAALERVVSDLEGDALSLESSIARYQEGVGHLAACRRILDAAEQRLVELVATPDGGVAEKPLAVGPDGLVDAPPATGSAAAKPKRAPKKPSAPGAPGDDLPF